MSANPVDLISGLTTSDPVSKSDITFWAKGRVPQVLADATEVRNTTLSGQSAISLKATGWNYFLDTTDTTTPDDGLVCIISADGKRFKLLGGAFALDTDGALTANSDARVPSQKAVKTYAMPLSYLDTSGTLAANSDSKVPSQKAVKTYAVTGPATSTNNGFARFSGTGGRVLQDHAATIDLTSEVANVLPTANGGLGNAAGAWTTWTPTVTPQTGSFTSVAVSGAYYTIGKLVFFHVTITITTAGTAANAMSLPLPVGTAKRAATVVSTETAVLGGMGYGRIAAGGSVISAINKYDNSTYIANGSVVTISGFYEQN
ncbi:hypothetical protein ACRAVF_33775 (plasmid) [Bradyrhizobium oligotrophicum S58]